MEKYQNVVKVKSLSAGRLERILEYIYQGNVGIDASNVVDTLNDADFVQIHGNNMLWSRFFI